jgi:hypothetical protein
MAEVVEADRNATRLALLDELDTVAGREVANGWQRLSAYITSVRELRAKYTRPAEPGEK